MTTPTPGSQIDVSDVNVELAYSSSQETNLDKNIVRQLTNQQSKQLAGAELLLGSDLSNKTAFESVYSAVSSNVVTDIYFLDGEPVKSSLILLANSDLYAPTVNWSWVINNDSVRVSNDNLTLATSGKNATITLATTSGERTANLTVSANVSVDGHSVGTLSKTIKLTANVFDQGLLVTASPSTTVNNIGTKPQTASITLKAVSNPSLNQSLVRYRFTPTKTSGIDLSPATGSDNITFTVSSPQPSINESAYSILTELLYDNKVIGRDTKNISLRTEFVKRDITSLATVGGVTSNNNFANDSSQYATLDITAIHNSVAPTFDQGTITFTFESSGDAITTQTIGSTSSSATTRISLFHNFATDGFNFKKAVVNVIATLTDTAGYVMDVKRINGLVLRTGAYGLNLTAPPSTSEIGYSAQTATSIGVATWKAGSFQWGVRQFNGSGPELTITEKPGLAQVKISAKTSSAKNAGQPNTNTCNYDLTGTIIFDDTTVVTRNFSDILIKAQSLPYTYTISTPATSNVVVVNDGSTTASLLTTAAHNIPGGTVQWDRDLVSALYTGIVATTSSANVFVTSPTAGGSNNQSYTLKGTLYDGSARAVEELYTSEFEQLNIDATTLKLQILGDPNVSASLATVPTTATATYEATSVVGSPSIVFPPTKVSGSTLETVQDTTKKIRIIASSVGAAISGVYSVVARTSYRGQTREVTKVATVSATVTSTAINVTKNTTNATKNNFFGPQTASVIFSATTDLAGGVVKPVVLLPSDDSAVVSISGSDVTISATRTPIGVSTVQCKVIYELRDSNGTFIRDNSNDVGATTATLSVTITAPNFSISDGIIGTKTWSFVNIDPSIPLGSLSGYPHPHPRYAYYYQTHQYGASFSQEIPNPKVVYNVSNLPTAIGPFGLATGTIAITGASDQNLTANGSAGYYDYFDGVNPSNDVFIKTNYDASYTVAGELLTGDTKLTSAASKVGQFQQLIPGGRIFDLNIYTSDARTRGPRMYWTRDSRGNDPAQWNFSVLPGFNSYSGGRCKWLGFHSQTVSFPNFGNRAHYPGLGQLYDPNFDELKPRPLYNKAGVRFYSSSAHQSQHGNETPAPIIPNYYFMVLGFQHPTLSNPVDVFLIGSDQNLYGPLRLWAWSGSNYIQNDTGRSNDGFQWWIYEMFQYPGVSFTHCIISNGPTGVQGIIPGAGVNPPLTLVGTTLPDIQITDSINLLLGTVSGGSTTTPIDSGGSGGGGIFDRDYWDNVKLR